MKITDTTNAPKREAPKKSAPQAGDAQAQAAEPVGEPSGQAPEASTKVTETETVTETPAPSPKPEGATAKVDKRILANTEIAARGKNKVLAYLFWIILGLFGIHRFYMDKRGTGWTMLILALVGYATIVVGVGLFLVSAVLVWWVIDGFLLMKMVEENHAAIDRRIESEY